MKNSEDELEGMVDQTTFTGEDFDQFSVDDGVQADVIFMNHLDSYHGKNISKFLSKSVIGSTLGSDEDIEGVTGDESEIVEPQAINCFKIVGTLKDKYAAKPPYVVEVLNNSDHALLAKQLFKYTTIIYDISEDASQLEEARAVLSEWAKGMSETKVRRTIILISTIMTWAKTKPIDPDDPDIPFTEEDYRRRKAHPRYQEHLIAEKKITALGKKMKKIKVYIVAAGITYGMEESILHPWFKCAWHNAPVLNYYGDGENFLPTIYINDLAVILQNIIDSKPKATYFLGVDGVALNQRTIVKAINKALGSRITQKAAIEDAFLLQDWEQSQIDHIQLDLRMDAGIIRDTMNVNWINEDGFPAAIQKIVREYRESRNLLPLKICILGPPGVGKTSVAKHLHDTFKLHHLCAPEVIQEGLAKVKELAAITLPEELDDENEDKDRDEELEERIEEAKLLWEEFEMSMEENDGVVNDDNVIRLFQLRLMSNPCQNQGFILDGYPTSTEIAKSIFSNTEEGEEEDAIELGPRYNVKIMPEFIFHLDATNEFLKERIMKLPERDVTGTSYTEENYMKRLLDYRSQNTEDLTVLNYFEEIEVHPVQVAITEERNDKMLSIAQNITCLMGQPRNYGPSPEELEEMRKQADEERVAEEEKKMEEAWKREKTSEENRRRQRKCWMEQLAKVQKEEEERVAAQSIPLRNYLMEHVLPILSKGVMECVELRPDDPLDYLAEYLFTKNPGLQIPSFSST